MTYSTAKLVRTLLGINDLTMLLGAKLSVRLDYQLINACIDGLDRSSWSAEDNANADAAIKLIDDANSATRRAVDSYLTANYTLPLEQSVIDESPLRDIATKMVAYELYINPPEHQVSRYNTAIKQLESFSSGKMRLSESAPEPEVKQAYIAVGSGGNSTFNLDAY